MDRARSFGLLLLLLVTPLVMAVAPAVYPVPNRAEPGALVLLMAGLLGLGIVGTPRPREDRPDAPPTVREAPAPERRIA